MDDDFRTTREIYEAAIRADDAFRRRDTSDDVIERAQQYARAKDSLASPPSAPPAPPFSSLQHQIIACVISELRREFHGFVGEELQKLRAEQSDTEEFLGTEFGKFDREIEHNRKQLAINNHDIAKLREELLGEIGAVRADTVVDRAARGEVLSLPQFVKRRSDAA